MVLNCLGDQSQQFNCTGFKISVSFSELPWRLFLISSNPLKSNSPKYCTPSELYNDESNRGYIDPAKVLHIFFSAGFIKYGWLSEQKQIEIFKP